MFALKIFYGHKRTTINAGRVIAYPKRIVFASLNRLKDSSNMRI